MDIIFALALIGLLSLIIVDHFIKNDELAENPIFKIAYMALAALVAFGTIGSILSILRNIRYIIDIFINFNYVYGAGHGFIFKMFFKLWQLFNLLEPICQLALVVAVIDKAALGGKVFDGKKVFIICVATLALMVLVGLVFPFVLNIVGPEYWHFSYNLI